MRPFRYAYAADRPAALKAANDAGGSAHYLAGGTTLIDLMKLDVMRPRTVVDINALAREHSEIRVTPDALHLGALARMADVADDPAVRHAYPMIAESLDLAASPQIRNMASLGGNVLQRTRCPYFRDTGWAHCNKREPGSGCAARQSVNRKLAILGVSDHCIANYPGDFAVALAALRASVDLEGPQGRRVIPFEALHRLPGETPHIETTLKPGELITGFSVPAAPWLRRSLYLKVRDRASYEFAIASAAVALDLDGRVVRQARIGLGGVAAKPWPAPEAEAALVGQPLTPAVALAAAEAAFAQAVAPGGLAFKPELGRRTLVRAILAAGVMEV
ncbi:xanthine dehydrogenase family protein subunit M [Phenylobacterium sp.]|jgi:xanthine dehydrogenase YagS FAD-binding subunit|uniref:FAD binding domain-containing protein n=1 Tax=Phenylobacterium sp. TaxID=1871053 RepID=UPI002F42581C